MKIFIVTSVDCGEDSDYIPHCLGIFNTKVEAKKYVKKMIDEFVSAANKMDIEVDNKDYFVVVNNGQYANKWNIDELEYN